MVQITAFKPPEEAHKPEAAWVEGDELHFNHHKYDDKLFIRLDTEEMFKFSWIQYAVIKTGTRGGFKDFKLYLKIGRTLRPQEEYEQMLLENPNLPNIEDMRWIDENCDEDTFRLSNSHKDLCLQIAMILIKQGIRVKKEVGD